MLKLKTKHFLTGEELSREELEQLISLAIKLKSNRFQKTLENKTLALLFEKPSLRTRVSFSVAINQLAGNVIELNSQQSKKEHPADTLRVLQGYVDGLMVRTFAHENLLQMCEHAKIPVINGLSDIHHPCQVLADLQSLKETFGHLQGLTLCYFGDGNNMLHSLLLLAPFVGVNVNYSCPEGFQPNAQILNRSQERAKLGGAIIKKFSSPKEAAAGANALYTDVWTSMGFETDNHNEYQKRINAFSDYKLNSELYYLAADNAAIMHCMPIHENQEITREMVEHKNSILFRQSENRLHAQKALLIGLFS